jgi:ubiquinone/menaquinone biosynthesis C-methylase UbiE
MQEESARPSCFTSRGIKDARERHVMDRNVDYDTVAAGYDCRYDENAYTGTQRKLLRFVGEDPEIRVLEVGCGTGYWLDILARPGRRLWGLDGSARMLALAKPRTSRTCLVLGSAEYLPWRDASFDRLFCINAFHHFGDKHAFLKEVRRVLKPNGSVMIVGLDPHTGLDRWYIYDYFEEVLDIDRRRYPSAASIRAWMEASGFERSVTTEAEHIMGNMEGFLAFEQGRLDKGFTSQLTVLTNAEYREGIARIRDDMRHAKETGRVLRLIADLRLFATIGYAGRSRD